MAHFRPTLWTGVTAGLLAGVPLLAQEPEGPTAKAIQDNSFLVEEAYNQEPGVVQHIFNLRYDLDKKSGPDDQDWNFVFTQEWPVFSQTHQFSYTLPYSWLNSGGQEQEGIGDVLLNYRFQALYEDETRPAFAPRISLILPTGDEDRGLGNDTLGYQVNLPLSKIVHDRLTLHANAGLTFFPDLDGRDPVSYNLAGSVIYAPTRNFNLMLEWVGDWIESGDGEGGLDRDFSAVVSPGVRQAFNFNAGQLVLGVAGPIGLSHDAPDYGLFLYLSWEHRFLRP